MNNIGAIFLIGFFLLVGAMVITETWEKTENAKAGLEECPLDPYSYRHNTIWVKDCEKYIESFRKALGEKK